MNYVFETGAVVWLNSGGPYMTVVDIILDEEDNYHDADVICQWFDHDDDGVPYGPLQTETFRACSLTVLMDDVTEAYED